MHKNSGSRIFKKWIELSNFIWILMNNQNTLNVYLIQCMMIEVHLLRHKSKCFQLNVRLLIFAFSTKSNPPSHMIWVQHYETRPQQQRSHCPGRGWLCSNCLRHLQVKIAKGCHKDCDHQRNKSGISNQMCMFRCNVHLFTSDLIFF